MIFELAITPAPAGYGEALLPLAAAKAHLEVLADDDDDLIEALRDAAIDMIEQLTGLILGPRTGLIWRAQGFGARVRLGRRPVTAITAISYKDTGGDSFSIDPATARIGQHGEILPAIGACWPADVGGDVQITFNAGLAAGAAPTGLIHAAKMFLAHLYTNREAVVTGTITDEIPLGVQAVCALHRLPLI